MASGSLIATALLGAQALRSSNAFANIIATDVDAVDGAVGLTLFGAHALASSVCTYIQPPTGACGVSFALQQSIGAWTISRWISQSEKMVVLAVMIITHAVATCALALFVAREVSNCPAKSRRRQQPVTLGLPVEESL